MSQGDEIARVMAMQDALSEFTDHVIAGTALHAVDTWGEAVLTVRAVGTWVEQERLVATGLNGAKVTSRIDIDDLDPHVDALRRAYYTQGVGTWYRLDLTLTRQEDGGVGAGADLGYDEDPGFRAAHPHDFAADQERYPRSPEHIPAWVQTQLDRAPEEPPPGPRDASSGRKRTGFWQRLRGRS